MESLRSEGGRGRDHDDDDTGEDAALHLDVDGGAMTPELDARRLGMWDDGDEEAQAEQVEWVQPERSRRQRHAVDWRDEFDEHRVGEENFGLMDLGGARRRTRTTNTTTSDE